MRISRIQIFPLSRIIRRCLMLRSGPLSNRGIIIKSELGFTLIEIMIVIGIGILVLATGLPPFVRGMKKEGLRKAVSDMVEACSHARSQSILKGRPVELVIRAEDGNIAVEPLQQTAIDQGSASEQESSAPLPSGASRTQIERFSAHMADHVGVKLLYVNFQDMMEFPEARVRFFPNGTCDEFTVILFSDTGEQKISLDIVTALADVEVLR